ncbi:MAG: hypothetical protein M1818_000159 [Claussenomyces sp. TS43310]|nr:MAG: hypothetical protein M1818_000159 [Claussenomyces sp. TS43310]
MQYRKSSTAPLISYFLLSLLQFELTGATITTSTPTITTPLQAHPSPSNGTCVFHTINHITQTLPAICWRDGEAALVSDPGVSTDETSPAASLSSVGKTSFNTSTVTIIPELLNRSSDTPITMESWREEDEEPGALEDASFLSFEDWKKKKRDQAWQESEKKKKDGTPDTLEGFGEDTDIDLDFGAFLGDRRPSASTESEKKEMLKTVPEVENHEVSAENAKYRSKDAGKTCKERFNFASLDAGAQVMKVNPEAKSASALLSENRDYYMLNICQAKNQFVIIELSESILVETVAVANFEFFSSTFRQFRVSVSDRYPQKLDRWVELGTFEARNSRDIQAFLIEDSRIWARYIRIEFLNHYGNEFYCPVSLLRVHGDTMIQDLLNMEKAARGEDDAEDESEETLGEDSYQIAADAVSVPIKVGEKVADGLKDDQTVVRAAKATPAREFEASSSSSPIGNARPWLANAATDQMSTPWNKTNSSMTHFLSKSAAGNICLVSEGPPPPRIIESQKATLISNPNCTSKIERLSLDSIRAMNGSMSTMPAMHNQSCHEDVAPDAKQGIVSASPRTQGSAPAVIPPHSNAIPPVTVPVSDKMSRTTTSHIAQPTIQESFFKTVTKRLQLLEANSTLSLKYIEEQSKILREAFTKVERRQLAKTTAFLENLNSTVFAELRLLGENYDQVWESTVVELETQRDQSRREIAAVTARLNVLADELVFQKRMAIVQSVLLLLCLALVFFSQGIAGGCIELPVIQNMLAKSPHVSNSSLDGPSTSSAVDRIHSFSDPVHRRLSGHARQRSEDSVDFTNLQSRGESPATPISAYSDIEHYSRNKDRGDASDDGRLSLVHDEARNGDDHANNGAVERARRCGNDALPEEAFMASPPEQFASHRPARLRHKPGPVSSILPNIDISYQDEMHTNPLGLDSKRLDSFGGRPRSVASFIDSQSGLGRGLVSPSSPSPSKGEERDFIIARKPLPPLPDEDS